MEKEERHNQTNDKYFSSWNDDALRLLRVMVLSKTDFYIDKIMEPFLGRDNNSSSCSYQGTNLLNSLQKKQPYILLRKDQKIAC